MMNRLAHLTVLALIVCALPLVVEPVAAQQFGGNRVRHQTFEFQVLRTEHFDVHYDASAGEAVWPVARMAERWHTRLTRVLAHDLQGAQPLILYGAPAHFQQTNVIDVALGEGVGGFIESARRRIVMPLVGDLGETDHVLGHELVHAFQFDMIGTRWPLWFMEGMAEYLSLGSVDAATAVWLRDAALDDRLPTIEQLHNPRFFPYRYGHALFAYIGQRFGDQAIPAIMRRLGAPATQPIESLRSGGGGAQNIVDDPITAIELALGIDRRTLSREWHESIRSTMLEPVRGHTASPGDRIIEPRNEQELNVGPVLSPDGSRLAFLTSRNGLSIDLAIADATTGRVERTLIRSAANPHFDSLQFIQSAGTWDPNGERIAIAAVRRGRPLISIFDAGSGRRVRDIPLADLDEAIQPAWSPDGVHIVFSGLQGGLSDLFLLTVESGELRRLTRDAFAERQPAWSPDGRTVVFVTDRFSGQLDTVQLGADELATLDVGTGQVARLAIFPGARHGSPQWTEAGLHFVANPDGVPDVYLRDPASGATTRLTRSTTGVIGITAASPALSVARSTPRVAFALHRGSYEIRRLDGSAVGSGEAAPADTTLTAARLAPAASERTAIDRAIADATTGLPVDDRPDSMRFRPSLALDFVGQEFTVSTGGAGPYLSGGLGLRFSDMLGDHIVEAVIQANGELRDIGGRVGYQNRRRRWNWGGFLQHVPAVTASVARGSGEIDGQPVFVEQEVRDRQVTQQWQAMVEYPFSRARRLELGGGMTHYTFNRRVRINAFNQAGQLVFQEDRSFQPAAPMNLGQATAALVSDTSRFGMTAPILGSRSRFEISPMMGELDFAAVTLDARRYEMPVRPVTIAGRVMHIGRYGGDAESPRLSPFFLGFPTFVRGYDVYSFRAQDCAPEACIQLGDLQGSRLIVGNLEVRAPLVGLFRGRLEYGALPVDVFGFFDTGIAWNGDDAVPGSSFSDRPWVRSAGGGARINVFGFLVAELSAARALDRPNGKWQFVFALAPGF